MTDLDRADEEFVKAARLYAQARLINREAAGANGTAFEKAYRELIRAERAREAEAA